MSNYKFRTARSIVRGLIAGNLNRGYHCCACVEAHARLDTARPSKKTHTRKSGEQRKIQCLQLVNRANAENVQALSDFRVYCVAGLLSII